MKSIKELKNPDIVTINGDKYQVINNTSLWHHGDRDETEMVIELVKTGEGVTTPNYRLTYILEKPSAMKFFVYEKDGFEERKLESIKI